MTSPNLVQVFTIKTERSDKQKQIGTVQFEV